MSQDVDKLKRLVRALDGMVETGEKAAKDGLQLDDAKYVPEAFAHVKELVALWKHKDEMLAELKDIDFAEAIELAMEVK